MGPTHLCVQRLLGDLFLGNKVMSLEAVHSSVISTEINNAWSYTSTFHTSRRDDRTIREIIGKDLEGSEYFLG
jgi:hypothetical protein